MALEYFSTSKKDAKDTKKTSTVHHRPKYNG